MKKMFAFIGFLRGRWSNTWRREIVTVVCWFVLGVEADHLLQDLWCDIDIVVQIISGTEENNL